MKRQLWIPVKPKVKQRPRLGRGRKVFTPQITLDYEAEVRGAWADQWEDSFPDDMPLAVDITYTPDGSLILIQQAECDLPVGLKKGDIDNYVKATLDGLQGQAFHDDKMVVELAARKRPRGWLD